MDQIHTDVNLSWTNFVVHSFFFHEHFNGRATFMYPINPLSELLSTFLYCFYLCNVSRIE